MRVMTRRIGLALVFTAVTASAAVLLTEEVYTKAASRRLIAPAAVMVETAAYRKIIPSEVDRDTRYWYPLVGDHSN